HLVLGGNRLPDPVLVLGARDHPLLEHPLEDEVAARGGGTRVLDRVVERRRRDQTGKESRLLGRDVARLASVRVLGSVLLLGRRVRHPAGLLALVGLLVLVPV